MFPRKGKGNYSYKAQIWEWKVLKCGKLGENGFTARGGVGG